MAKQKRTDKAEKGKIKSLRFFYRFVHPYRWWFFSGLAFLAMSSATSMAIPYFMGEMINAATEDKSALMASITQITLWLIIILIVQATFSFLRVYAFSKVSIRAMADIRTNLFTQMMSLPVKFYEMRRIGELSSRITNDVEQMQSTLSFTLAEFLRQAGTLVIGVIIVAIVSPELTLFMILTFPLLILAAIFFGRFIRRLSKKAQDYLAESNVIVEETMQGVHMVKAYTNERLEISRFLKSLNFSVINSLKAAVYRGGFVAFLITGLFGSIVAVLWYGAQLVDDDQILVGDLFKFMIYMIFIGASVAGMGNAWGEIQKTAGATERMQEILHEAGEIQIGKAEKQPPVNKFTGSIEFDHVGFSYPTRPDVQVLKDISFKIKPGQKIALAGQSGAGKSTIIQLLLRFHEPLKGEIRIDGKDYKEYDLHQVRGNIGIVPQEVILFGGTIRENIAYGKPDATEDEIVNAAMQANAWTFIEAFPEGLDTVVGERGIKLSGGQRQRIAIARAILKDPAILVLDEATSSLDSESESLVQSALEKLMKGRTTVIIAHRLATIRQVDQIYVLDHGRIIESGTHDELINLSDGLYRNLARLQFQD